MKKLFSIVLVVILILASITTIFAEGFLPSATYEKTPEIVVIEEKDDEKVIAYVENAAEDTLNEEYLDCFLVTPVIDAKNKVSDLPDEAEQLLVETYEALTSEDVKLSVLIPELNDVVKEAMGAHTTADDLVMLELFDITPVCEELISLLAEESNTITMTFKIDVPKEAFLTVMTYNDGRWQFVEDVKNNYDGTVSVKFSHFCPVLFLAGFPAEQAPTSPVYTVLIAIPVAILLGAVVAIVYFLCRKKK